MSETGAPQSEQQLATGEGRLCAAGQLLFSLFVKCKGLTTIKLDCQPNSRAANRFSSRELVRGQSGADAGTATQIADRVGARTVSGRF